MYRRIEQASIFLFLSGVLVGSAFEALYVYTGIEHYPSALFFGLAWWVPLLFGCAAVTIGLLHPLVDPLLQHRRHPQHLLICLGELGWLVLDYLISASMLDSLSKTGLLIIIYLNFWLLTGRSWQNLLFSIVSSITGTLIEMILVTAGAFSYIHPDVLGVPYWLPFIYATASLAIGDLGRSLLILPTRGIV